MKVSFPGSTLNDSKPMSSFDLINPIAILILSIAGIIFIYSAQISIDGNDWKKQILWVVMGIFAYFSVSLVNYKYVLKYAHFIYFFGIFGLLLATPLSPLSVEMMGARRWIDLGFTTVQPTEAAKIATLIMAASLLARSNLENFKESLVVLLKVSLIFTVPMLLIFMQPDLGSTLVFPPMILSLIHI